MFTRRKVAWFLAVALVAAIVVPPWVLYHNASKWSDEQKIISELRDSFEENHPEGTLVQITEPQDIYVIYWEDAEAMHASMKLDGLWVEVAKTPKESD